MVPPRPIRKERLCSPHTRLFAVGFYPRSIPREFSHAILVVVYLPPRTKPANAWDVIHSVTTRLQTMYSSSFLFSRPPFLLFLTTSSHPSNCCKAIWSVTQMSKVSILSGIMCVSNLTDTLSLGWYWLLLKCNCKWIKTKAKNVKLLLLQNLIVLVQFTWKMRLKDFNIKDTVWIFGVPLQAVRITTQILQLWTLTQSIFRVLYLERLSRCLDSDLQRRWIHRTIVTFVTPVFSP